MIAVQGPRAIEIAQPLVLARPGNARSITPGPKPKSTARGGIVSRTGYTGEDGCELIVPAEAAATSLASC